MRAYKGGEPSMTKNSHTNGNGQRSIVLLFALAIIAAVAIGFVTVAQETTTGGSMGQSEQTDLSGTYTGVINYPEGNMSGDATLTITGNQFTLQSGGTTQTGRVTAVTTRGYTAVTMRFGEGTEGTMPVTISLRARRTGDRLTLTTVQGETRQFSFAPAGGRGSRRRGTRNRNTGMDANMTGDMNMNSNMDMQGNMNTGGEMNGNMTGEMNANMGNMNSNRRPRTRRNRNSNMRGNMNSNMSGDMNMNMSGDMNMNGNMSGNMNANTDMTGENMNANMSGNMNSNRRPRRSRPRGITTP
jgi:hypothetical protein